MKKYPVLLLTALLWACSTPEKKTTEESEPHEHAESNEHSKHSGEEAKTDKKPKSPRTASMAMISGNHVHIDYSSPSMRGRTIFGGLVALGEVWVTGAHKATNIKLDKDATIGGTAIPAGKYGLFTIPGESQWTIIINKDWDMHLADDYDEANDIVRLTADVVELESAVEALTFEVAGTDEGKGTVTIKWENTSVSFEVINVNS